jgi:hypothetical protein
MEKALDYVFVKLGIQNTALLCLMAKFMWDMRGKYIAIDKDLANVKEDVHENKTEIKGIKNEQEKIKLSIAEKFSQKKESQHNKEKATH